jgi:hypothetical protein
MLSHVFVGISDFERAFGFYSVLMDTLDLRLKFRDNDTCWAGWMPAGAPRPLFVISRPYDGRAATAGNGQMLALPLKTAPRSIERMLRRSLTAVPVKAHRVCALTITRTITARTFAIPTAISSVCVAMSRPRTQARRPPARRPESAIRSAPRPAPDTPHAPCRRADA